MDDGWASPAPISSLAARDLRPLVLPPPLIWGRNVQITVLGADVLEGR